jgi:phage terminase Nu1 subunit (DNA packaging protein)
MTSRIDTPTETATKAAFARTLGVSRSRVTALVKRGLPIRSDGKIDLPPALKWVRENVEQTTHFPDRGVNKLNAEAASTGGGADDGPLPFPEAKAMRETYLAKIARLEYQVRAGTLLERSAVVREWASALRDLRARLLAVPARCGAVLPHLDKSEVEVIAREIRAALAELAGGDNAG